MVRSRVAEHVLGFVASRVGTNPEEALLDKLNAPLKAMADSLAGSAVDAAYDPRVSPVARKFLSLLSGRECSPSAKTGGLAAKLKGGTSAAGTFADSGAAPPDRHRFDDLLSSFSDTVLAALEAELWNLTEDSAGSAFLQAMLNAHTGDSAALNWIIPGFLGCSPEEGTKEGELLAGTRTSCQFILLTDSSSPDPAHPPELVWRCDCRRVSRGGAAIGSRYDRHVICCHRAQQTKVWKCIG